MTPANAITPAGASGPAAVAAALRGASAATGAGFELLYNMAKRESSLDPTARAKTSSAAGLFQFIEQTWLAAVKSYGERHGLSAMASDISQDPSGRLSVADPERRKAILDLRYDPEKAAALAGELAQENRAALERRLGRSVNEAEVYAAHFLGAAGAAKLLSAPADARAADLLPQAAAANRPVFFGKDGAKKSVSEVIASFERSIGAAPAGRLRDGPSVNEIAWAGLERKDAPPPRAYAPSPAGETRMRLYAALGGVAGAGALTPLALAVLQSLDPTGLGEPRDRTSRL